MALEDFADGLQRSAGTCGVRSFFKIGVPARKRDAVGVADQTGEPARGSFVVEHLAEVESQNGAAVERTLEPDQSPRPGCRPPVVVQVDQVFDHVLHGLGPRIDSIHFQLRVAHALRCQPVQQSIVVEALGSEEIRVGQLVIRCQRETAQVVRFGQARVVVAEQAGSILPDPIMEPGAIHGRQPHAAAGGEIHRQRPRLGENVAAQLVEHGGRFRIARVGHGSAGGLHGTAWNLDSGRGA